MFKVQGLAIIPKASGYISLLRHKSTPSLSWGADNSKNYAGNFVFSLSWLGF
jgi:hypothetical protein